ncbi:FliM/FliN family flagellar motor switch protein [Oryzifoliimicrobium ureilyticus]|uniref:FliM/FliN family flagellar motor switch protein n=1 Tax=Oryzifoliimicrobium ureilyticus TaxID=3113724 RepID=UPI00307662C9
MNAVSPIQLMDEKLLARLTGRLGDGTTIEKISAIFGEIYREFLPDIIKSETDFDVEVEYVGCRTGYKNDLIARLDPNVTLVDAELRNWSPNITFSCGNAFVITLMEHLLGADPATVEIPVARPLSAIEIDLAITVFEKFASVLRSAVNAPGGFEPTLSAPHRLDNRPKPRTDAPDEFAAEIRLAIALSGIKAEFALIVPQAPLLKSKVSAPKAKNQSSRSAGWTEQLSEQVRRSTVTLDAKVRLQDLTLRTISRLQAGDVIPFFDAEDVQVNVGANGKELYVCELGRSGESYTVRVKDTVNSDDDLIRHLMS